jgi:hypothetical protein
VHDLTGSLILIRVLAVGWALLAVVMWRRTAGNSAWRPSRWRVSRWYMTLAYVGNVVVAIFIFAITFLPARAA